MATAVQENTSGKKRKLESEESVDSKKVKVEVEENKPKTGGGRDAYLLRMSHRLIAWLMTLDPIQKNKKIIEELEALATNSKLPLLKKWILEQIRPNVNDMEAVIDSILGQYQLIRSDFTDTGVVKKFILFLHCLNDSIKK